MLIKIVVIGRLKDRALQARCDEFAKWLGPYAKLEIRELPDSTVEREGKAILKELDRERGAAVVVLSEEGREFTSTAFASVLGNFNRKVVFVIGGPYGLDPAVKARAEVALETHLHPRNRPVSALRTAFPRQLHSPRRQLSQSVGALPLRFSSAAAWRRRPAR